MTIKKILEEVRTNEELVDGEKAEFLYLLYHLFEKECAPYQDEIDEMIANYD